jgi:hypothetical protein
VPCVRRPSPRWGGRDSSLPQRLFQVLNQTGVKLGVPLRIRNRKFEQGRVFQFSAADRADFCKLAFFLWHVGS